MTRIIYFMHVKNNVHSYDIMLIIV